MSSGAKQWIANDLELISTIDTDFYLGPLMVLMSSMG